VDKELRELERQAATGDSNARARLDEKNLKLGRAPSFDYIVEAWETYKNLQKNYLKKSIDREVEPLFEKHPLIEKIFWEHNWDYEDTPLWLIHGITLSVSCYPEDINVVDKEMGVDFSATDILDHLQDKCECYCFNSDHYTDPTHPIGCVCYYEDDLVELTGDEKSAFKALLTDVIKLHQKLNRLDWDGAVYKKQLFVYERKK